MGRITMSNSGFQDFIYRASILRFLSSSVDEYPSSLTCGGVKIFWLEVSITFQPLLRLLPFRVRDDPYPASYEFL
jgi:hypothetical protein